MIKMTFSKMSPFVRNPKHKTTERQMIDDQDDFLQNESVVSFGTPKNRRRNNEISGPFLNLISPFQSPASQPHQNHYSPRMLKGETRPKGC